MESCYYNKDDYKIERIGNGNFNLVQKKTKTKKKRISLNVTQKSYIDKISPERIILKTFQN